MYHLGQNIYNKDFVDQNMMGPNSLRILEELMKGIDIKPNMRILDLGCGKGLTSIFLAKEYGVQVFAVDLWISATDNYKRFAEMGVEDLVIPIHADANELPFADEYFDGIVSVDAYHYVGNNDRFFAEKIRPLLKKDAIVAIAFPGMRYEVTENFPEEMRTYWAEDALEMWHSIPWWQPKFAGELNEFRIWEMECFDKAWEDWFLTDNPYAAEDKAMLKADSGRYMNLIGLTGRKK